MTLYQLSYSAAAWNKVLKKSLGVTWSPLPRSPLEHKTSISSMKSTALPRALTRSKISLSLASEPPEYWDPKSVTIQIQGYLNARSMPSLRRKNSCVLCLFAQQGWHQRVLTFQLTKFTNKQEKLRVSYKLYKQMTLWLWLDSYLSLKT